MKINWKLRLKNPATLIALITLVISVVYQILTILEIVPKISESQVMQILNLLVEVLAGLGVIVDPTTKGVNDSERALEYDELG